MQPIFIFSLPRSGSTLLQRILATHEEISSTAETWLLLNCLAPLEKQDVYANYNYNSSIVAINDFIDALPNRKEDFLEQTRNYILDLYSLASEDNVRYFVDKTPRYHLIVSQIHELFPNAKYIFLFRNPLSVLASIMTTWGKGKYNLYRYNVDLIEGCPRLIDNYYHLKNESIAIKYEDLVINSNETIRKICDYLEIDFNNNMLNNFKKIDLQGRMGDSVGVKKYKNISSNSLGKWKTTLNNPYRKFIVKRHLDFIGENRLAIMGYSYKNLLKELNSCPSSMKYICSDIVRSLYGYCYNLFEFPLLKNKIKDKRIRRTCHR